MSNKVVVDYCKTCPAYTTSRWRSARGEIKEEEVCQITNKKINTNNKDFPILCPLFLADIVITMNPKKKESQTKS